MGYRVKERALKLKEKDEANQAKMDELRAAVLASIDHGDSEAFDVNSIIAEAKKLNRHPLA